MEFRSLNGNQYSFQSLFQFIKKHRDAFHFSNGYLRLPCTITEIMCLDMSLRDVLLNNIVVEILISLITMKDSSEFESKTYKSSRNSSNSMLNSKKQSPFKIHSNSRRSSFSEEISVMDPPLFIEPTSTTPIPISANLTNIATSVLNKSKDSSISLNQSSELNNTPEFQDLSNSFSQYTQDDSINQNLDQDQNMSFNHSKRTLKDFIRINRKKILLIDLTYEFQLNTLFSFIENETLNHLWDLYSQSPFSKVEPILDYNQFLDEYITEIDEIFFELFSCIQLPTIRSLTDLYVLLQHGLIRNSTPNIDNKYNNVNYENNWNTINENNEHNTKWDLIIINDLNLMKDLSPFDIGNSPFNSVRISQFSNNEIFNIFENGQEIEQLKFQLYSSIFNRIVDDLLSLTIENHIPIIAFKTHPTILSKQLKSIKDSLEVQTNLIEILNHHFMPQKWIKLIDQTIYLYSRQDGSHPFLVTDTIHLKDLVKIDIALQERFLLKNKIEMDQNTMVLSSTELMKKRAT